MANPEYMAKEEEANKNHLHVSTRATTCGICYEPAKKLRNKRHIGSKRTFSRLDQRQCLITPRQVLGGACIFFEFADYLKRNSMTRLLAERLVALGIIVAAGIVYLLTLESQGRSDAFPDFAAISIIVLALGMLARSFTSRDIERLKGSVVFDFRYDAWKPLYVIIVGVILFFLRHIYRFLYIINCILLSCHLHDRTAEIIKLY